MKKILLVLSVCLNLASIQSVAQEATYRNFGLGASFSTIDLATVTGDVGVMPLSGLNFVINATPSFRGEFGIGYLNVDVKNLKQKVAMSSFGIGAFYTKRISSSVLMGGVRFDYLSGNTEMENAFGNKVGSDIKRTTFGPAFSYEYLFGDRIGVGGEVGLRFGKYDEDLDGTTDDPDVKVTYTQNALFVRAYF